MGFVNPPVFTADEDDEVASPASVGFDTGEPARARVIGAASGLAVEQWRQLGHPKAAESGRDVIADHPSETLDVSIRLDPGRAARFGPTRVEGASRTDPDFIEYMADIPEGSEFDPDIVDAARDRLTRLGVFRSIRIEESDEIAPDGSLPMTVRVEDRRPRTIGFGATLSTIDGAGLEAYWQHRNLFGRAERIRFAANIENLGVTSDPDEFNYSLGVTFTKPGVLDPDTDFVAALIALQNDFENYRERSVAARAGFQRQFGDYFNGSLFAQASRARYEDDFGTRNFTTFGIQGRAEYDRRRVDPLNAVEGYYLAADILPFYEAEFGNPALRGTVEARGFYSIDEDFALCRRRRAGLVGSYLGPDAAESPPDLLFFTGGGGSVRGYAFRSIGVEVPDGEDGTAVIGGRGLLEGSLEMRVRLNESFGVVGFVDTGFVTEEPGFSRRKRSSHRRRSGRALLHSDRRNQGRPRHAGRPARRGFPLRALYRHRTGVLRRFGLILAPLLIVAIAALAQSDDGGETNENGFLANLLQNTLSAPGRQIRLQDVSGLLSSTATIGLITVSDDEGVWARVDGAEIDWSRASLLLGRVNVNSVERRPHRGSPAAGPAR